MITFEELKQKFKICKPVARDTLLIKTSEWSEFNYYVNLVKGKITAVLDEEESAIEFVRDYVAYKDDTIADRFKHIINDHNDKFTGSTMCHAEDTFDIEKGMRIARSKALKKKYSYMKKIDELSVDAYKEAIDIINERIAKNSKRIDNYEKYIDSIRF